MSEDDDDDDGVFFHVDPRKNCEYPANNYWRLN